MNPGIIPQRVIGRQPGHPDSVEQLFLNCAVGERVVVLFVAIPGGVEIFLALGYVARSARLFFLLAVLGLGEGKGSTHQQTDEQNG